MDVLEAIETRRSHLPLDEERVPTEEEIHKLLDAATRAPNHFKVEPWRFVVVQGDARRRLGEVLAESLKERFPDMKETALEAERNRPVEKAPVIIAVAVEKPKLEKEIDFENILAVGAAVQNMLLAAHSLGLAATWRTGAAAYDPKVKQFLGLDADQHLAALVYLGYPKERQRESKRIPYTEKTNWINA